MPSEASELIAASRFAGIVAPAGQPGTEASGTQKVVAEAPAGSASAASAITPTSSRPLPLRTRMLSPTYRLGIVPQNLGSLGMRRFATLLAAIALALALASPAAADAAPKLRAGAGQADIQPPQTGYYLGGYTRAARRPRAGERADPAHAHALRTGRVRQLPDLQHGGAEPGNDPEPDLVRRADRPQAGRPPALHVPAHADHQVDPPGRPRPRPRRGGMGVR